MSFTRINIKACMSQTSHIKLFRNVTVTLQKTAMAMWLVSEGMLEMVILIKACGPNNESLTRLLRTKLDSGLSERLSLCVSLCGKYLVLVSCVFWQRQSDLFVSHISTTMQPVLVLATNFRRLCKTNTTGVLESLIFVTESTEAFLLQAIIVYKYQIWSKRQFVNSLSMPLYSIKINDHVLLRPAQTSEGVRLPHMTAQQLAKSDSASQERRRGGLKGEGELASPTSGETEWHVCERSGRGGLTLGLQPGQWL